MISTYNSLKSWLLVLKQFGVKNSLLGRDDWENILKEFEDILDLLDTSDIKQIKKNSIDRLGLALEVLRLNESDIAPKDISLTLKESYLTEVSEQEVADWLTEYSNLNYSNKMEKMKGSVFDTQSRMQELYETLVIKLEDLSNLDERIFKKASKPEVEKEYLSEIRQLLKDASILISSVSVLERARDFQRIVLETIKEVSPSTAHLIQRKLTEKKMIMDSLVPY